MAGSELRGCGGRSAEGLTLVLSRDRLEGASLPVRRRLAVSLSGCTSGRLVVNTVSRVNRREPLRGEVTFPRMAHRQAAEGASITSGGREAAAAPSSLDNVPLAISPCVTRLLSDGVARCHWTALRATHSPMLVSGPSERGVNVPGPGRCWATAPLAPISARHQIKPQLGHPIKEGPCPVWPLSHSPSTACQTSCNSIAVFRIAIYQSRIEQAHHCRGE